MPEIDRQQKAGEEIVFRAEFTRPRVGKTARRMVANAEFRAYGLGNLRRRLVPPKRIEKWSLSSLQQQLVKIGGRLVKYSRYYGCCWRSHLTARLFGARCRIAALPATG